MCSSRSSEQTPAVTEPNRSCFNVVELVCRVNAIVSPKSGILIRSSSSSPCTFVRDLSSRERLPRLSSRRRRSAANGLGHRGRGT